MDPEKAPAVNGKPPLSENGARLKAKDLVAQLKAGADFAELAKQHSTDSTSAQKGGDLGSFKHDAKIPTPLKDVIFSLEPGAFSEARQHGGRFYIFHVTAVDAEPMQQVKNDMAGKIQATKMREKVTEIRGALNIDVRNEAYMKVKPSPPGERKPLVTKDITIPPPPNR